MNGLRQALSCICFLILAITSQNSLSETWQEEAMKEEMARIAKLKSEGKTSNLDLTTMTLKAAKMYVPHDTVFIAFLEEMQFIFDQYEKKKISQKKRDELVAQNFERFDLAVKKKMEAQELERQMAETRREMAEYERRRSAEESRRVQREREEAYARQQAAIEEENRSRAATATLLQGIGNAFRRTYPGGTTCNTWGNNTTCTNY